MVKRSYRDGWATVIVDDASYRWLHWCFVRKGAAKIASVGLYMGKCILLAVVTSIQCMVKPFMDAGLAVRPVWCCDYIFSTLDDLYDAIL
nr:hypothetical protein [Tanacetum cinerariifolium]